VSGCAQSLDQSRKFIREGPIKQQGRKRKRYFYLFSDVLLVCKVNINERKVFDEEYQIKGLLIDNMQDTPGMPSTD
jgi:hypothetical protein